MIIHVSVRSRVVPVPVISRLVTLLKTGATGGPETGGNLQYLRTYCFTQVVSGNGWFMDTYGLVVPNKLNYVVIM